MPKKQTSKIDELFLMASEYGKRIKISQMQMRSDEDDISPSEFDEKA